ALAQAASTGDGRARSRQVETRAQESWQLCQRRGWSEEKKGRDLRKVRRGEGPTCRPRMLDLVALRNLGLLVRFPGQPPKSWLCRSSLYGYRLSRPTERALRRLEV